MKSRLSLLWLEEPPSRWDWLLFAVLAVACYVTFQHGDIQTTGSASLAYLQGHFFDFYDHNLAVGTAAAYFPSTYLVFAAWNLPLWLLGLVNASAPASSRLVVLMWYKLLPTLFYLASAVLIYRIGAQVGLGRRKARVGAYLWLTTPIAFFGQFIFGQYDSLGIFLVLIGVYYYFKKDLLVFALLCGLAFTFKYFSLFVFLPLLLLMEKRIPAILARAALFAAPALLELALYIWSPAFRSGVLGTPVASYIWGTSIWNGYVNVQLFLIAWLLVCASAYFVEPQGGGNTSQWGFYFTNVSMFLLFGLSFFHPQWLLWATPFWVISTLMNRKADTFLALDILMMLFFTLFTVTFFDRDVDQQLFGLGVLKGIAAPVLGTAIPMRDFFLLRDASFPYSVLSALMLVNAAFKHPRFCASQPARVSLPGPGLIRTRFIAGIAIFVLPASASLIMAVNSPPPSFSTARGDFFTIGPIAEGQDVRQVFLATTGTIDRIQFLPGRYEATRAAQLNVRLLDPMSDQVVYEKVIDAPDLVERTYYTLRIPSIKVTPGQRYILAFGKADDRVGDYLTLYRTAQSDLGLSHYAVIDGVRQSYDLVVRIYGH